MMTVRELIWENQWAFSRTVILRTAIQLRIFDALHRGHSTVAAISRACHASPGGVRRLLQALVAMDLLKMGLAAPGRFRLARGVDKYLVPGEPEYIGDILARSGNMMEGWASMTKSVASGRPWNRVDQAAKAQQFYPALAAALFGATLETAGKTAEALGVGRKIRDLRILDVAAGSGVWSIVAATRDRSAMVTAVDFPSVLKVTRRFVRKHRLTGRFRYLSGDIRKVDFGREAYDLVFLGQICHSEGPVWTRRLLRKASRCLVRGGHLVIAEFLPNNERSGPLFPLVFSLHMFLMTQEGDTFSQADFGKWLRMAGFSSPKRLKGIRPPAAVLHARKK